MAKLAFYGQLSAVDVFNNMLCQWQAQPSAGGHFAVFLHPIETLEHSQLVFFAQSDAGILHFDVRLHVAGAAAQRNTAVVGSVFNRVG